MKRGHLSGYVFLVVIAALLFSVAAGAQDTCEEADALYNLKLYDEAQKAYIELLKNNTDLTCAQNGINKSRHDKAEEFYNLGEEYEKARQYDLARNAYIEALKINSNHNKSLEALARVSGDPFEGVRTLLKMGLYTEAGESFKEVIKENPGIDVPEGLKYHFMRNMSAWGYFRIWTEPFIRPIGEIMTFVGIALLVVWLIHLWRGSREPRLDIEDFDKGATDLDLGKGLAAMVEVSFKQIGELGAHGSSPILIEGPIEKLEIPADVKSLHPYLKIVSALFEWLLRTDVYTLSGYLQKPWGDRGAGLTLSLVRKKTGEIIANRTIWQKDFDPPITPQVAKVAKVANETKDPAPYYRLAEPAAIWTLFHEVLAFNKKLTPFGTENWLSFAYFRAGVRWTREGRKDKARKLYLDALNRDMNNRSALFNLGALDVEAGEYELAITRLQMARENEPKDLVWYKATYQLAATYHYKSMQDKDEAEKLWRQAESEATKEHCFVCSKQKAIEACRKNDDAENGQNLAESEAKELHKAIKEAINPQKNENKELRKFLESFKPMADIMYAAILVGTNKKGRSKSQKIIDSYSTKHLQETRTREGGRGYKTYSKYDKLNYRDHYNLACYYSVADNNKKAWEHLKYALKRGGEIVQWAQKDPSLEGLREYKECKFDDLIKECSAPVTPSADLLPLAGLKLIGATYAKHLKELGIVSHDDLILKAKNCHAREELAKKLCIDPKFLQRWALLADMMRIVGIETQYANLLEAAGVRSLDDLKVRYSHDLTELLHQVNSAQSLVKQLPLEETVQQWVRDAQKTTKHIASD